MILPSFLEAGRLLKYARSNVLHSLILLSAIVFITFTASALLIPAYQGTFVYASIGTLIFTLFAFGYFAITNPKMLQSEKYQIEHMKLNIMKGENGIVSLDDQTIGYNPSIDHEEVQPIMLNGDSQ